MLARFAYAYVFLLAALEILISILTFALHMSVIMGVKAHSAEYATILFRASVFLCVPAVAFQRDRLEWFDQVKSCPAWMWKTALGLATYSGIILVLQMLFSEEPYFSDYALIMSGRSHSSSQRSWPTRLDICATLSGTERQRNASTVGSSCP